MNGVNDDGDDDDDDRDDPAVLFFDVSSPEGCIESIQRVRDKLLESREGEDVRIKYKIRGRRVYLHTQRDDLYAPRFNIDDGPTWSVERGSDRQRYLGIGTSYTELTGKSNGVRTVCVGYPRFAIALNDILNSFTPGGWHVSEQRAIDCKRWKCKLGNGLATLIVMTIESCRSFYIDEDLCRLIRMRDEYREVYYHEGTAMLQWGKMSDVCQEDVGNDGFVWRNSPLEDEDAKLLRKPLHAWDCTAVRQLKKVPQLEE